MYFKNVLMYMQYSISGIDNKDESRYNNFKRLSVIPMLTTQKIPIDKQKVKWE